MRLTVNEIKEKMAYILPAIVAMPFYRKKYNLENLSDELAMKYIVENFYELPKLTRSDVQDLTCVFQEDERYTRFLMTGGTSGVAGVFAWCDEDIERTVEFLVAKLKQLDIKSGDYVFSTIPVGMSVYGVLIEGVGRKCSLSHIEFERFPIEHYEIAETILRKYNPKMFFGTPAGMLEMIRIPSILEALQSVEVLAIAGAVVSKKDVETLQTAINCQVLDIIGSTEMGLYGGQELGCSGFHLAQPESVICEIEDPDEYGNGKCIMTCLHNTRMPIVRYENGDKGCLVDSCACGYQGPVYMFTGRISETCYLGGTKIEADCFEYIAKAIGANTTFQALIYQQEVPPRVQLNIVDKPIEWRMKQVLNKMMYVNVVLASKIASGAVAFDIAFIEDKELIGLNERGKWRRVLDR